MFWDLDLINWTGTEIIEPLWNGCLIKAAQGLGGNDQVLWKGKSYKCPKNDITYLSDITMDAVCEYFQLSKEKTQMLHKETVKPGTLDLIHKLMKDSQLNSFYLVGGTALSLRLAIGNP
ncbi:hypothetical protein [Pedobacter fastidiosus]